MSDRYDIVVPRTYKKGGEEKTTWTKIGVAFPTQKGGYKLIFEALPLQALNREGNLECTALLMEPRDPKHNFDPEQKKSRQKSSEPDYGPGDIPF